MIYGRNSRRASIFSVQETRFGCCWVFFCFLFAIHSGPKKFHLNFCIFDIIVVLIWCRALFFFFFSGTRATSLALLSHSSSPHKLVVHIFFCFVCCCFTLIQFQLVFSLSLTLCVTKRRVHPSHLVCYAVSYVGRHGPTFRPPNLFMVHVELCICVLFICWYQQHRLEVFRIRDICKWNNNKRQQPHQNRRQQKKVTEKRRTKLKSEKATTITKIWKNREKNTRIRSKREREHKK